MSKSRTRLLAVIELGTTSIRMVIAQPGRGRHIEILDELEHAVSLGHDTLRSQTISSNTTERCVSTLTSFRNVLNEYGIASDCIRVVATSAVREASNRNTFIDRILVATGLDVEILDQAEVSRLTYRAVRPLLQSKSFFKKSDTLVAEVGGGSTETLLFRKGRVSAAHLYRLGALRLRALLDDQEVPRSHVLQVMQAEIDQTLTGMQSSMQTLTSPHLVMLGSDARLAATQLRPTWNEGKGLGELPLSALKKFAASVLEETVDGTAKTYGITYTEAETLGPSLSFYVALAKKYKLKKVLVADSTLRMGILTEMITGESWTLEFRRQVMSSAQAVAKKFNTDLRHGRHVAAYGQEIISVLRDTYSITDREVVIFEVAALLHESGQIINMASHHKHSRYLILNSDIFGLGQRDITMAALVARYHRRAIPKPSHSDYMALSRVDRIGVSKLSAILRVANALDLLHGTHLMKTHMSLSDKRFTIEVAGNIDVSLMKDRVKDRAQLFEDIFGKEVVLRTRRD